MPAPRRAPRRAKPWSEGVPVARLTDPATLRRARRGGVLVVARCPAEADAAAAAGVAAAHVMFAYRGGLAAPLRHAALRGVGYVVAHSPLQAAVLGAAVVGRSGPPWMLLDLDDAGDAADDAAAANAAHPAPGNLVVGCHAYLPEGASAHRCGEIVERAVITMARWWGRHGEPMTRVTLSAPAPAGVPVEDTRLAGAVEDALDVAYARSRFPRPALVLAPM